MGNFLWLAAAYLMGSIFAGSVAWQVQGWRMENQLLQWQRHHAEEQLKLQEAAHAAQLQIDKNYQEAFHAAQTRERALRAENQRLRHTSDGLRTQLASIHERLATTTRAAAIEYASAVTSVFDECQSAITALAEKADGHANDVRHHRAAWPRNPTDPAR